jgi:hypothetical protein
MPQSFTKKCLEIEIIMNSGSFAGGGNAKIIRGLACQADIEKPGGKEKNSAKIKIWGLPYSDLENMTMLAFRPMEAQKNLISLKAGDEDGPLALAFAGEISSAFADFNSAPDIPLQIEAAAGFYPQRLAAPPVSVNGQAAVADLIAAQAREAGYSFRNEGVSASVNNAVFNGSPMDKIQAMARQVGAELLIDDNQIIIMPAGGARAGAVPLLADDSGLNGYPTFSNEGISCKCLYRPDLEIGGLFVVKSIVPRASGTWKITKLSHSLSAYQPDGGEWQSVVEGQYVGS